MFHDSRSITNDFPKLAERDHRTLWPASLGKQQSLLLEEKRRLDESHTEMRRELDRLIPRHAALKQAYRDARATIGLAILVMLLGGALVGMAGAISDSKWKERLLWSGGASFLSGFVFALQASIRNQPDDY